MSASVKTERANHLVQLMTSEHKNTLFFHQTNKNCLANITQLVYKTLFILPFAQFDCLLHICFSWWLYINGLEWNLYTLFLH